ncbi:spore cortex biosynthesis protein YabQ [Clostridium sp. DL1XJH146]
MILPLIDQFNIIMYSLISGLITGLSFDLYRVIRGFEKPNRYITYIEDILFWILIGIIDFIFLLYKNYSNIGIFVYILLFIGIIVYLKIFSNKFIKLIIIILKGITKLARMGKNILVYPFEVLYYKIFNKNCK